MTLNRPGSQYSDFFQRMRARPLSSWSIGDRAHSARTATAQLAALSWQLEHLDGTSPPPVPDLGAHVYADQLRVLIADAIQAGADPRDIRTLMSELADQLSIRLDSGH